MPTGPLDALKSLHPLDATAFTTGQMARDVGGDRSFAQHFQAATAPPRKTDAPAASSPPAARKEERAPASQPAESANSKEQPARADGGNPSAEPIAADGKNSETKQETPSEPPVTAASTKEKGAEETSEEQEEAVDGDELLLSVAVEAPIAELPTPVEPEATTENPAAVDPLADAAAAPGKGQGRAAKKLPGGEAKQAASEQLPLPEQGEKQEVKAVETPVASQAELVDVATLAVPSVESPEAEAAAAAEKPGSTAGKSRGKRPGNKAELDQLAGQKVAGSEEDAEQPANVSALDVAPTAKTREGKKDRSRSEAAIAAQAKSEANETRLNNATAPPASATTATATDLTSLVPTDAGVKDAVVPPPVVATNGNASTTPSLSDNVSAAGRLPQHLLARGTTRGGSSGAPVTNAEQMRLIQRVAKAFQAAHNGDGELRLRLSPPELGALKLEIKLQSGVMTARVEAETSTAKNVILDNLPVLKERLAEQGIQVEKFDVDLMDRQPQQGQPESSPDRQQSSPGRWHSSYRPTGEPELAENNTSTSSVARGRANDGGLNVTV